MAYTPTVYTNDASSPDLDATNLNKSEQGIKLAHDIAVPVDNSSRVAEYTGDGIPLIPDNVAGRTYFQDEWATTDGWTIQGTDSSYSLSLGKIIIIAGQSTAFFEKGGLSIDTFSAKTFRVRIRKTDGVGSVRLKQTKPLNSTLSTHLVSTNWTTINADTSANWSGIVTVIALAIDSPGAYEIDFIYIGTGAYDTPALDRAGNGNSLALTAVTPVNGKYGKEMSFNGSTSFAQASSPVIGTTGTVAVRFKRGAIGSLQVIAANRASGAVDGMELRFNATNEVVFALGGSSVQGFNSSIISDVTTYHTVIVTYTASTCIIYIDGVLQQTTAITTTNIAGTQNLTLGRYAHASANFLNGIISHFRYDSRIWTADEARAWSLNPISIDSRV